MPRPFTATLAAIGVPIGFFAAGIGATLGGLQIYDHMTAPDLDPTAPIPSFSETIFLTTPMNKDFIEFLQDNDESIVFIHSTINSDFWFQVHDYVDASCTQDGDPRLSNTAPLTNQRLYLPVAVDFDRPASEHLPGAESLRNISITTDNATQENVFGDFIEEYEITGFTCQFYSIYLESDQHLSPSYGGTGLVSYYLEGFFSVRAEQFGGPEISYRLREIPADPEQIHRAKAGR